MQIKKAKHYGRAAASLASGNFFGQERKISCTQLTARNQRLIEYKYLPGRLNTGEARIN
jgi:hypothetical protein